MTYENDLRRPWLQGAARMTRELGGSRVCFESWERRDYSMRRGSRCNVFQSSYHCRQYLHYRFRKCHAMPAEESAMLTPNTA